MNSCVGTCDFVSFSSLKIVSYHTRMRNAALFKFGMAPRSVPLPIPVPEKKTQTKWVSVFVFQNGAVQIAGLQDEDQLELVLSKVRRLPGMRSVSVQRKSLLNLHGTFGKRVNLTMVCQLAMQGLPLTLAIYRKGDQWALLKIPIKEDGSLLYRGNANCPGSYCSVRVYEKGGIVISTSNPTERCVHTLLSYLSLDVLEPSSRFEEGRE